MKIQKTYSKKDIKEIAKRLKLPESIYLRSLINQYVVLKPVPMQTQVTMRPVCYSNTNDPMYFITMEDAERQAFDSETDIIMSAYNYLHITCGISY